MIFFKFTGFSSEFTETPHTVLWTRVWVITLVFRGCHLSVGLLLLNLSSYPRAIRTLRTHILRLWGTKTILYKAFGLFGCPGLPLSRTPWFCLRR